MNIQGFNKTTLLDYPGHLAATIFVEGCNFRCPFCHNRFLVLTPSPSSLISQEDILSYLKKRKKILEGVCITGGEPTIYPDLPEFIYKVKELGYKIKLDTNGNNPTLLEKLYQSQLLDYVAMDIKNSKEKYSQSIGIEHLSLDQICESVSIILNSTIPYEFRTTVVKELHTEEDFISIGKWITGAKAYYLQSFKDSDTIIKPGLSAYDKEELLKFITLLRAFVPSVSLRGVE